MLTLRTKADVLRAWRNGVAPQLLGQDGPEVYDGAVLQRGVLSPCSSFITHKLFAPGRRWRGKVFFEGGHGCNRFGGRAKNRFGITRRDAKTMERQLEQLIVEKKAKYDPLLQELLESRARPDTAPAHEGQASEAPAESEDAPPELRRRSFEARLENSRLDGRPALVLDYGAKGEGVGDALWGRVLGMRDELREVAPGVLVGLGSMRASGGSRNCAPFVLVKAEP